MKKNASKALKELAAELADEKARTAERVKQRLLALYPPSPRWSLPDPRARFVPNTDLGKPKDCVARSRELAPKGSGWED